MMAVAKCVKSRRNGGDEEATCDESCKPMMLSMEGDHRSQTHNGDSGDDGIMISI